MNRTIVCWGQEGGAPPAGTFMAVSVGDAGACAIRTSGRLACWAGMGTLVPAGRFKAVSAGLGEACAIRVNGAVVCWHVKGRSGREELRIHKDTPAGRYTSVEAGEGNLCAIRESGTMACWGYEPRPLDGTFTAISRNCALGTDGEIRCSWSNNPIPAGPFVSLSVGEWGRSCAIRPDGTLACWGEGEETDWQGDPLAPLGPPDGTFASVAAGADHTCAVRTDGYAVCWGEGVAAPLPTATLTVAPRPWAIDGAVSVRWGATRLFAPIRSYTVRYRSWRWTGRGGHTKWTWLENTNATSGTFKGRPGSTTCFEVRALDRAGLRATSYPSCTAVPLDERSMVRMGRWKPLAGAQYYQGTALRATEARASLRLYHVRAPNIGLLATTCPTCGSIRVYFSGTLVAKVSLRSAVTRHRQPITVFWDDCQFPGACRGTLVIKVLTSGMPVIIDGVLINTANVG